LILMTDEARLPDPLAAARALPKGAAIVLRHRDGKARAELAAALVRIARARGLMLLIAGDADLAARLGAHGLHLPEAKMHEAAHWRALRPHWRITVAAHSAQTLARARSLGADAALLASIFPTRSHVGRGVLGAIRFRLMARAASCPVYALGGVNAETVRRLHGAPLAGIAAIEALLPDQSR
jgi:thiamine-phosphate pyrophosphorylase